MPSVSAGEVIRKVMPMRNASRHAITECQVNLEVYGKALLGVEPNITPLI